MKVFKHPRSPNSYPVFTPPLGDSDSVYEAALTANTAVSFSVPSGSGVKSYTVLANCTSTFWVSKNGTAAVPSSGSFTLGNGEQGRTNFSVDPGTTLSFISDSDSKMTVSLFYNSEEV